MLWINNLASGSLLVLGTHILHFHKKNLAVLDMSRFTSGEIGPQSRLLCPLLYKVTAVSAIIEKNDLSHAVSITNFTLIGLLVNMN